MNQVSRAQTPIGSPATAKPRGGQGDLGTRVYPAWFYLPAGLIFGVFFLLPAIVALYFSLTRWTIFDVEFVGLDNFATFFEEPFLVQGLVNSLIFASVTVALSMAIGLALAVLLTSRIPGRGVLRAVMFFPVLVSTVGVGITFQEFLHPTEGLVNQALGAIGIRGPAWLIQPGLNVVAVGAVGVWKGVGGAALIFMAGIAAVPREFAEAAAVDGAGPFARFRLITLPLLRPSAVAVLILSLVNGLRSFDMIWVMTKGGPGFSSDVLASVVYKQYQSGYYGLATAGNVVLVLLIISVVGPLSWYLNRREVEL